jgi:hypothetical protein
MNATSEIKTLTKDVEEEYTVVIHELDEKPDLIQRLEYKTDGEGGYVVAHQEVQFRKHLTVFGSILSSVDEVKVKYFLNKMLNYLKTLIFARQLHLQHFLIMLHFFSTKMLHFFGSQAVIFENFDDYGNFLDILIENTFHLPTSSPHYLQSYPIPKCGLGIASFGMCQTLSLLILRDKLIPECNLLKIFLNFFTVTTSPSSSSLSTSSFDKDKFLTSLLKHLECTAIILKTTTGSLEYYAHILNSLSSCERHTLHSLSFEEMWNMFYENLFKNVTTKKVEGAKRETQQIIVSLGNPYSGLWMGVKPLHSFQKMCNWQVKCAMYYRFGVLPFLYMNDYPCPLCQGSGSPFHFLVCKNTAQIRTKRDQLLLLLLGHFFSSIPDSTVEINRELMTLIVGVGDIFFDPSPLEVKVLGKRKSRDTICFSIQLLIALSNVHTFHQSLSLSQNGEFDEQELIEKEEREFQKSLSPMIPFGISTSAGIGRQTLLFLSFITRIWNLKGLKSPFHILFERISLVMEASRAAMLRLFFDQINDCKTISRATFQTMYELPGKYPSSKTPLVRYLYMRKVWSIWTAFFFSFPVIPHSPNILVLPLEFSLKPYDVKMNAAERSKLDGENHAIEELEVFLHFPSDLYYDERVLLSLPREIQNPLVISETPTFL